MKCPRCGATSHVLDTRNGAHLTTSRRRECDGPVPHRFTTVEMHQPAVSGAKQRLAEFAQTAQRRAVLWHRDREIAQQMHLGWKALARRYQLEKSAIFLAAKRGRNS